MWQRHTHVDDSCNVALDRGAAEQEVDLVIRVPLEGLPLISLLYRPKHIEGDDLPNRRRYSMHRKVVCRYATVTSM